MWLATSSLESYVHELLRKYVGRFVSVPREGFTFSLWAGEGLLEGVSVCAETLGPLRVVRGVVAIVRLKVPWHALRSEPVTIRVEGLVLHLEPSTDQHAPPAAADGGACRETAQQGANTAGARANPSRMCSGSAADSGRIDRDACDCTIHAGCGDDDARSSSSERKGWAADIPEVERASNGSFSGFFESMAALILSNIVLEIRDAVVSFSGVHNGSTESVFRCTPPCGGHVHSEGAPQQRITYTARIRELRSSPADGEWRAAFLSEAPKDHQPSRWRVGMRGFSLSSRQETAASPDVNTEGIDRFDFAASLESETRGTAFGPSRRADQGPAAADASAPIPVQRLPCAHISLSHADHTAKGLRQAVVGVNDTSTGHRASNAIASNGASSEDIILAVRVKPLDGQASWADGGEDAVAKAQAAVAQTERKGHTGSGITSVKTKKHGFSRMAPEGIASSAPPCRYTNRAQLPGHTACRAADDNEHGVESIISDMDTVILLERFALESAMSATQPQASRIPNNQETSIQRMWLWLPTGLHACVRESLWKDLQSSIKMLFNNVSPLGELGGVYQPHPLFLSPQQRRSSGYTFPGLGLGGAWDMDLHFLQSMPEGATLDPDLAFAPANSHSAADRASRAMKSPDGARAQHTQGTREDIETCTTLRLTETEDTEYIGIDFSSIDSSCAHEPGEQVHHGVCVHLELRLRQHLALVQGSSLDDARILARLSATIRDSPHDPMAHYRRASKLLTLGLEAEAARDAAACLQLDPQYAKAHFVRGRALYALGEYRQAFHHYEQGLELDPRPGLSAWLAREMARPGYRSAELSDAVVERRVRAAIFKNDSHALAMLLKRCKVTTLLPCDRAQDTSSGTLLVRASSSESTLSAESALQFAAQNGHADCVVLLLRHGVPATGRGDGGRTPLMTALHAHHADAALALIPQASVGPSFIANEGDDVSAQPQADVHAVCDRGQTALHLAAKYGLLSCTMRLLDVGASPAAKDKQLRTPLHAASAAGEGVILTYLLRSDHGRESIDARDVDGCSPALLAARTAHAAFCAPSPCSVQVERLLQCSMICVQEGCKAETATFDDGRSLIHFAAALGAQDLLGLLLAKSTNVNALCATNDASPLHYAAAHGQTTSVRLLLAARASVDSRDRNGFSPIEYALHGVNGRSASQAGRTACYNMLLRHLAR